MIDSAAMADTLYGESAPAAPPAPAPAPSPAVEPAPAASVEAPGATQPAPITEPAKADPIAAAIPEHLRAQREANKSSLYDPIEVLPASAFVEGLAPELQAPIAAEVNRTLADIFGGDRSTATSFVDAIKGYDATVDAALAPAARADAVVEALNSSLGMQAAQGFELARALVALDPRLSGFLSATGAGNSPRVIVALAKAALAHRSAGNL